MKTILIIIAIPVLAIFGASIVLWAKERTGSTLLQLVGAGKRAILK